MTAEKHPAGPVNPLVGFLVALQFLTVAPAVIRRLFTPRELGQATAYFPLAGGLVGAVLALAAGLFAAIFPAPLPAALTLAVWVGLSGALHLDGFLDACDGLLGGFDPESRLRIMRDERVGAFALAGGALLLLLKFSALAALAAGSRLALPALLLAPVLGRWAMAVAVVAFPYARAEGLGRAMKDQAGRREALLATLFALLAIALVTPLAGAWQGLAALLVAGGVLWAGARFALGRIPGLTGDLYGALNECVELAVLLVFAAGVNL